MIGEGLWPPAVRYRARRDLRAQWRSLVLLSLLIGVGAGALLACVAGARRTDSAFERLRDATRSADLYLALQCDASTCADQATRLEQLPGVDSAVALLTASGRFETGDGRVIQDGVGNINEIALVASLDRRWGDSIDRPVVHEGRLPDPSSATEVAVTYEVADQYEVTVGDRLLVTVDFFGEEAPVAHDLEVDIVGVVMHPVAVRPSSAAPYVSAIFATHTLGAAVADDLAGGAIAVTFQSGAGREVLSGTEWEQQVFIDLDEQANVIAEGTDNDAYVLLAIALIGGVGSFGVLAPTVIAAERSAQADSSTLRAVGFSRRDVILRSSLHGAALGVASALVALVVAIIASRWTPIAEARRFEPAPGVEVDVVVVPAGGIGVAIVTLAVVVSGGWAATRRREVRAVRTSWVGRVSDAARLGPTSGLGMRVAFARVGSSAVGFGSLLAIVLGAAGIVGALTFSAGLDRLESTPRLVGADYELYLFHEDSGDPEWADRQVAALLARPEVESASGGTLFPIGAFSIDGIDVRWVLTYDAGPRSNAPFVVTDGRAPVADDEILVHPDLLETLGGLDHVVALSVSGGPPDDSAPLEMMSMPYTLVGGGVIPVFSEFRSSASITVDGLRRLVGDESGGIVPYVVTASFAAGSDHEEVTDELIATAVVDAADVMPVPSNMARDVIGLDLDGVDRVPKILAIFLAALGGGVLAITIAGHARAWRRRIAVHRTLGLSTKRSGAAVILAGQLTLITSIVIATPLGIVAGRALWLRHAAGLGVIREAPVPWAQLALTMVAAVVLTLLVTVAPAWRCARQRLGWAMRAE